MITSADSFSTFDLKNYYAIFPTDGQLEKKYRKREKQLTPVEQGFAYNSGSNPDFLTVSKIRELIKQNIDATFAPI